jgi:hypothetical protein
MYIGASNRVHDEVCTRSYVCNAANIRRKSGVWSVAQHMIDSGSGDVRDERPGVGPARRSCRRPSLANTFSPC